MKGINKVILLGTITSQINARPLNTSISVSFNLATNRNSYDENNEREEITEFTRIVINGPRAENTVDRLHTGQKIYVEGYMKTRKWTDEQGIERPITEIICEKIEFLMAADHVYQQGFNDTNYEDEGPEPYNQEKYNQNRPAFAPQQQNYRQGQPSNRNYNNQSRTPPKSDRSHNDQKKWQGNSNGRGSQGSQGNGFNQNRQGNNGSYKNSGGYRNGNGGGYRNGNGGGNGFNQQHGNGNHNSAWQNNKGSRNQGWQNGGNQPQNRQRQFGQNRQQDEENWDQPQETHFSHSHNR